MGQSLDTLDSHIQQVFSYWIFIIRRLFKVNVTIMFKIMKEDKKYSLELDWRASYVNSVRPYYVLIC